jgi:hypothetical protein
MNQSVATHLTLKYKRAFSIEWGMDAKAFCNYYRDFYLCGCSFQAFKLISYKHFVATTNVTIPLPTKWDPLHSVSFVLTSQNDLKKNLGVSTIKVVDNFKVNDWIKLKNSFKLLPEGWSHTVQV